MVLGLVGGGVLAVVCEGCLLCNEVEQCDKLSAVVWGLNATALKAFTGSMSSLCLLFLWVCTLFPLPYTTC